MTTRFYVPAKEAKTLHKDNVSKGDAETYEIDFTAWQEDNTTISSVTWTVESGSVSISGQTLTSGVASALLTFSHEGKQLVTVLADTGTEKKKIWLEIYATDRTIYDGDYGMVA